MLIPTIAPTGKGNYDESPAYVIRIIGFAILSQVKKSRE